VRVSPRLQSLIVAASLAGATLGAPAAALAQSAGDEQYQDPLAGSTTTAKPPAATTPKATTPQVSPSAPDPAAQPQLSAGSPTTAAPAPSSSAVTPPAQTLPSALPNTGLDGRILAGLGIGMLLLGVGLRLRTARERF
jgi:hypothetical protein